MKLLILSIIILSYDPAPGQFVNLLPAVTTDAAAAAQTSLERGSMVTLGAAGGSITARFTTPVTNSHDYDITVYGNSFSGSAEPGVIYVSEDVNHNGVADDPWYEIAGSEYANTVHNYRITYYKPESDTSDITYRDSEGNSGTVLHTSYHTQAYYPAWITADSLVFTGALLPSNVSYNGSTVVFSPFEYGYADNQPNSDTTACSVKIDWAVDSLGNPADLQQVDFIRIQTGVLFTESEMTGELSTEISAIHPLAELPSGVDVTTERNSITITDGEIIFSEPLAMPAYIYTMSGALVATLPTGITTFSIATLTPNSVYILRTCGASYRFIR